MDISYERVPYLASFPGRVGGEKTAWYPLLAHARAFPEGLVSTACACASIPRKPWEFVFVCKWSVKLIRICPIHFRIIEKKQVRKALSVRGRCLETCHAVRNLLHKCPEFPFDCLDFAYAGTAGKPSPLSTDTADMRSNLHRRERQSSHNPTSLKRAAEYLGRPSE